MIRRAAALCLTLALTACGSAQGGEDFTVTVNQPVAAAYTPLGNAKLPPEITLLFSDLKVVRSRPDDTSVRYTIPGANGGVSTILLVFESTAEGRATIIHASVDVPAVRAVIAGKQKVISEAKIERELQALIADQAKGNAEEKFGGLLAAIAISTNPATLTQIQQMAKDPGRFADVLAALESDLFEPYDAEHDADNVDVTAGDKAEPGNDPEAALAQQEYADQEAESRRVRKLDAAGSAGDDAAGAAPEPDMVEGEGE